MTTERDPLASKDHDRASQASPSYLVDALIEAVEYRRVIVVSGGVEKPELDAARATLVSLIASQASEIGRLREKVRLARMLSARLHLIHDDGRYVSVWTLSANAGRPYNGPTYEAELAALDAVLTPEERQP